MIKYNDIAPSDTKVLNPCIECTFYKEVRHGFLWQDRSLYCTYPASKVIGYNPITGLGVYGKDETLSYARKYECKGKHFIEAYPEDGIL